MATDDTCLNVTTRSKDTFGKADEKTTRLNFPIVWTVNKNPSIVNKETVFLALFGPSGIIIYLIGYKIFGALIFVVYSWFGVYTLRSRWNLYKLGTGNITIDSKGFNDSRLGPNQIPWSVIRRHVVTFDSTDRKPFCAVLISDDSQAISVMTVQYKRANLFSVKKKHAVFKLPLKETQNREAIAQAIQTFIKASQFD